MGNTDSKPELPNDIDLAFPEEDSALLVGK
jgi:hypothetical protein